MPRITLAFDGERLMIIGKLYSPNLTKGATIKFLIDTGSSVTILSLREAEMAGLKVEELPRSAKKSGGYGGAIELRLLNNVILVFASDDFKAKSVELPSVAVQYSPLATKRAERMVYSIPTVLGTDVLSAGNFSLWADWDLMQAHLDYL